MAGNGNMDKNAARGEGGGNFITRLVARIRETIASAIRRIGEFVQQRHEERVELKLAKAGAIKYDDKWEDEKTEETYHDTEKTRGDPVQGKEGEKKQEEKESEKKAGKKAEKEAEETKEDDGPVIGEEAKEKLEKALKQVFEKSEAVPFVEGEFIVIADMVCRKNFALAGAAEQIASGQPGASTEMAERIASYLKQSGRETSDTACLAKAAAMSTDIQEALGIEPKEASAFSFCKDTGTYVRVSAVRDGENVCLKINGEALPPMPHDSGDIGEKAEAAIRNQLTSQKTINAGGHDISFRRISTENTDIFVSVDGKGLKNGEAFRMETDQDVFYLASALEKAGVPKKDADVPARAAAAAIALVSNQGLAPAQDKSGKTYDLARGRLDDGKACLSLVHTGGGLRVAGLIPENDGNGNFKYALRLADYVTPETPAQGLAENMAKLSAGMYANKGKIKDMGEKDRKDFDCWMDRDTWYEDKFERKACMEEEYWLPEKPAQKPMQMTEEGKENAKAWFAWAVAREDTGNAAHYIDNGDFSGAAQAYANDAFAHGEMAAAEACINGLAAAAAAQTAAQMSDGLEQDSYARTGFLHAKGTCVIEVYGSGDAIRFTMDGKELGTYEDPWMGGQGKDGITRLDEITRDVSSKAEDELEGKRLKNVELQIEDDVEEIVRETEDGIYIDARINGEGEISVPLGAVSREETLADIITEKLEAADIDNAAELAFRMCAAAGIPGTYPQDGNCFVDLAYEDGTGFVVYANYPEAGEEGYAYRSERVTEFAGPADMTPEKIKIIKDACRDMAERAREELPDLAELKSECSMEHGGSVARAKEFWGQNYFGVEGQQVADPEFETGEDIHGTAGHTPGPDGYSGLPFDINGEPNPEAEKLEFDTEALMKSIGRGSWDKEPDYSGYTGEDAEEDVGIEPEAPDYAEKDWELF